MHIYKHFLKRYHIGTEHSNGLAFFVCMEDIFFITEHFHNDEHIITKREQLKAGSVNFKRQNCF